MIKDFVKPHKISSIHLDKQKNFVSKKVAQIHRKSILKEVTSYKICILVKPRKLRNKKH